MKLVYLQQEKLVTHLSCLACLFHKQSRKELGPPPVGEGVLTAANGSCPLLLSLTSRHPVSPPSRPHHIDPLQARAPSGLLLSVPRLSLVSGIPPPLLCAQPLSLRPHVPSVGSCPMIQTNPLSEGLWLRRPPRRQCCCGQTLKGHVSRAGSDGCGGGVF